MSYWWISYGKFAPDESGFYPAPGQVVAQYRVRAGVSREDLALYLKVGEKMLYYMEKEDRGLNSVVRLRELCQLLAIPLALFGLCAAPAGDGWWLAEYGGWPAGADGWPSTSEIVKWYRRRVKHWTQFELAEALGLSELAVRKMEHTKAGLDSLKRRQALQFLLGIPPLLLGLDAAHLPTQLVPAVATPVPEAHALLSLEKAQTIQARLWSSYYTGPMQEKIPQVRKLLMRIDDVLLQAPTVERPAWLEVQSLGYQWLGNVLRDHPDTRLVLPFNQKAVELARHTGDADLLSAALLRQTESAYLLGHHEQAIKFAQVFAHTQEADPVLSSGRAIASARVLALASTDQTDRSQVLRLVNQCQTFGDSYGIHNTPDTYILRHAQVLLNLSSSARDRAQLLSDASDLLERLDLAQLDIRHQVDALLTLTHVALARKEYDLATFYVLDAWPMVTELQSSRRISQIAEIHRALLQSSYASSPQVARLGLLLFQAGTL